jgi:mono/diheme cytochrome c family protein
MCHRYTALPFLFVACLALENHPLAGQANAPKLEQDVISVFALHCTKCHSGESPKAGLDLSNAAGVMRGGSNGPTVTSGVPDASLLFQRISKRTMPPASEKPLADDEIELVRKWIAALPPIAGVPGGNVAVPAATAENSGPLFERDIRPILAEHCFACHGAETPQAGLDLRTAESVLRGATEGPVVIKGSADISLLVQRVSSKSMPPKGTKPALTEAQIELLRKWIDTGASTEKPVIMAAAAKTVAPETPHIAKPQDREFWAFRKPVRSALPTVKLTGRVRTPIDAFVLAKLESKGLSFSPDAPKLTLMRRAYYDLVGLPPTPDEMRDYLADSRPDAYERLLDRLLATPQYGERWARHWLDVAGYNDEQGFANDLAILFLNDGIWRYRDYIIRSLNSDKGYDQLLTEQLAGDELVDWKHAAQYTQEIRDDLIATGYLRLMTDLTDSPEVNHPPYYHDVLMRQVDSFSSGVLGLTGGCARCHNHKYDPITQRDYYSLSAVFATGFNPDKWIIPKERFLADVSDKEKEAIAKYNAEIDRPLGELTKQLTAIRQPYEQKLFEAKLIAAVPEPLRADVRAAEDAPKDKRTDVQKYLIKKLETALKVTDEEVDKMMTDAERDTSKKLSEKIATLNGWRRSYGKIQALWDIGPPAEMHVLRRGMYETPGERVQPGFMAALCPGDADAKPAPDAKGGALGYRLALAHWVTSPDNPLTARVEVNRIWMRHFGKGIVATPDNFGKMGAPPTHPELLDWLAVDFMEHGWHMKRLHKMIMMSTVYRQSSRRPAEGESSRGEEIDSGNDLLWRANLRRADAEVIRDSALEVSGKLDPTPFGPPVALDATKDGLVTVAEKGETPTSQYRRSVYLLARRNYASSFLDVFDFPIMAINCTRRTNSATPLQSLTMLNGDFIMERSEDFAGRIINLAGPDSSMQTKVEKAFVMALSRKPRPEEIQWSVAHIEKEQQRYLDLKSPAGEAFKKALASLCQMLMASNEFLYID